MTVTPDWLQYGAFGLLAAVIYLGGKWAKGIVDKMIEKREEAYAQAQEHVLKMQGVMQALAEKATEDRDASLETWKTMTRMAIQAQIDSTAVAEKLVDRLDSIQEVIQANHRENQQNHKENQEASQEILKALRAFNGNVHSVHAE